MRIFLSPQMSVSLQRIDIRLSLLQSAVDEYNKAKNDFAAKVNLFRTIFPKILHQKARL